MINHDTIATRCELSDREEAMRKEMITLCAMLFIAAILAADVTTVKVFSFTLLGAKFLFPGSTVAFSMTFLATDVLCEVTGRRSEANKVVLIGLTLRTLAVAYYHLVVGDRSGHVLWFESTSLWTADKQEHLRFVLVGTMRAALAGLISAGAAFLNDTFVFNRLRARYRTRNLYWMRNGVCTLISQILNSVLFISIAFGSSFTVQQIVAATLGQVIIKFCLAWADTPFAYLLRNYGQGRRYWYAIWRREFYLG